MPKALAWFTVRLAIQGLSENQAANLVGDLQQQLSMSQVVRHTNVCWEKETRQAIVQLDTEGLTADSAADQMAEEVLELASALVIGEIQKEIRVEILDVASVHSESS